MCVLWRLNKFCNALRAQDRVNNVRKFPPIATVHFLRKIINVWANLIRVLICGNLLMSSASHYTRCHLTQSYIKVDAYKYSFLPSTIKLWNTLPCDIVNQESVNNFQDKLLTL